MTTPQFTADPNRHNDLDSPAFLRQPGIRGALTRAAVFCVALTRADPNGLYCQRTRDEQANEMWFEQDTD